MKNWKKITLIVAVFVLVFSGMVWAVNYATWTGPTTAGTGDSSHQGAGTATGGSFGTDVRVGTNLIVDGIITPGTFAPPAAHLFAMTSSAIDLTSPTVTFDVTNKYLIILGTNVNQTAVRPVNGVTGQEVKIYSSATGTATARFDDNGATLAFGANRTLTCGNFSFIKLLCTAGGSGTASTWLLEEYQAN